jgi:hypothetical protein
MDGTERDSMSRAFDQLGTMVRLGQVFAIEPLPAPRQELWNELLQRFPDLLA